jgi:Trypsin-co-occurring domain 2
LDIPIAAAIEQLRDQLRECILEGQNEDIVFTPTGIDVELSVTFKAEATAKGGFKLLALLDLSAEAKAGRESQHKIKLSLSVTDKNGEPLKIRSETLRHDLPQPSPPH